LYSQPELSTVSLAAAHYCFPAISCGHPLRQPAARAAD
jgi:hypothetical protein